MRHRRNEFSSSTKREAFARSGGVCECHRLARAGIKGFSADGCGGRLSDGNTFYEHVNPDAICGRNDLDNAAVLVKTCWLLKTNGYDKPMIAKSNRVRDRGRGIRPLVHNPLPGTKASGISKPFVGEPRWRDSGRPLRDGR